MRSHGQILFVQEVDLPRQLLNPWSFRVALGARSFPTSSRSWEGPTGFRV